MKQIRFDRKSYAVLAVVFCLPALGILSQACARTYDEATVRRDLLASELVVHGIITRIASGSVPRDSLFVNKRPGQQSPVMVLTIGVREVIKGSWAGTTIDAVQQGDPGAGAFIMQTDYSYAVGEEVVLFLHYRPSLLGGSYWIYGDSGSFVRRDGDWAVRGDMETSVSLPLFRSMARADRPEEMCAVADDVVLGAITSLERREFDCGFPITCIADYATVTVKESWKGVAAGESILVRALRRGTNLPWYAPVPPLAVGQSYVMFLRRDEVGHYPFAGFNGFLQVDGESVTINGHLPYSLSRSRLTRVIAEETGR